MSPSVLSVWVRGRLKIGQAFFRPLPDQILDFFEAVDSSRLYPGTEQTEAKDDVKTGIQENDIVD